MSAFGAGHYGGGWYGVLEAEAAVPGLHIPVAYPTDLLLAADFGEDLAFIDPGDRSLLFEITEAGLVFRSDDEPALTLDSGDGSIEFEDPDVGVEFVDG